MNTTPKNLIIGQLLREFIINPKGATRIDQPGGNILYALAGMAVWGENAGLISRVGEDYPRTWLDTIDNFGFDISGVKILPEDIDVRSFIAYDGLDTRKYQDPVGHFARIGKPFPKSLLGYRATDRKIDRHDTMTTLSIRQADIPTSFQFAKAAHFCSMDFLTHSLIPSILRQNGVNTVTLDPGEGYMNSSFRDHVPSLMPGLTAFIPSEEQIRALYEGATDDLWEMADDLSGYGCRIIIITRGINGQYLFDASTGNKYVIPAYPSRDVDPTGVGDAFCGGFLAGYQKTFDPLEAVKYGNVAASMVIEGSGPFYVFEALPGLAEARLKNLQDKIRIE